MRTSNFTRAKPAFGMPAASRHPTAVTSPQTRGPETLQSRQPVEASNPEYVRCQLQDVTATHTTLLQRLPDLEDLQASWLLLLFCASPRANYLLRNLPPPSVTAFAQDHDLAVSLALTALLQCGPLPAPALARAHLPLAQGGLGLLSATAAFWASWAGTLPTITRQATHIAARLEAGLHDPTQTPPSLQAAHDLHQQGWSPPQLADLPHNNQLPPPAPHEEGPPTTRRGWQQPAVTATHNAMTAEFLATLDSASQAMMASQSGPFTSRTFTTILFSPEFHYPSHLFRLLLLRRLRLPLPLTERHCRCRRVLGPLGDHRAACPRSGALRERGSPLGCAEKRAHGSPPLTPEHPFGEPC